MSVIRVLKNKDYTAMSKYHLKEKNMSLKAKGLLSQMLSLPEEWDYSIIGLTKINKDGIDSIKATLKELEEFGYLKRSRIKNDKGIFTDIEYTIYEKPQVEKPQVGNPHMGKPLVENPLQLNTNIINKLNNKLINNKKENIKEKFKKPTLEEIEEYCKERNNNIDAKRFYDYYETDNWKDVKNWKKKLITWEMHQPKKKKEEQIDWDKLTKELDGDESN